VRIGAVLLFVAHFVAAQDMLVVAPENFHAALTKWRAHKTAAGLRIAVEVPTDDVAAQVRAAYKESEGTLRFVMLVGDTDQVPCDYVMANAIAPHERDPRIATDAKIADLDGDGLPDLAVGRIPAQTPEQAARLLARSVAYETNKDTTEWRRRVNLVAGVGGFGAMQDFAIEFVTRLLLKDHIPAQYEVSFTYGNPKSPHCPNPPEFGAAFRENFAAPALFCAYMGHGNANGLDRIRYKNRLYPVLTRRSVGTLDFGSTPPIEVFLACTTGKFDAKSGCIVEDMLWLQNGPVAAIASSRVSMPYANAIFGKEFLDAVFVGRAKTLGEIVMIAKRRLVKPDSADKQRATLESLAATFYKPLDPRARAVERAEHVWLYNLFGDPSLVIARPVAATVECPESVRAGATLAVRASTPFDGPARIELTRLRESPAARRPAGHDSAEAFRKTYAASNQRTIVEQTVETSKGSVEAQLAVPETLAPGIYRVRVFVSGTTAAAAGSCDVTVTAAKR